MSGRNVATGVVRSMAAIAWILVVAFEVRAEVAESKRKLIGELLEISGSADMATQMSEQQTYVELMRIRQSFGPMMAFAVSEQQDLAKDEQQRLLEKLSDFDGFAEQFSARLGDQLNFSKIITDVYYPLYDESFSEDDLAQMVEFYRTAVGRKTIKRMPAIMQNASDAIDRIVRPVAIGVIQGIVADEREKLDED